MAFYESPRFPVDVSFGCIGGPTYQTGIVATRAGFETRNEDWSTARHVYNVAHAAKDDAKFKILKAFVMALAHGKANGFRFKDWKDYQTLISEGILGTGIGTGLPTYQIYKNYTSGAVTFSRLISKPVVGTFAGLRNGGAMVAGVAAGNYAIDTTLGIITFVADANRSVTALTPGATTSVTLSSAIGLATGKKLYLSGIVGTVGAALNGLAHTISNVVGAVYTLSTNTTGLAYTSGGTAFAYPQASDVFTCSNEFDVPCRFDTDALSASADFTNSSTWADIPIIEIRDLV